MDNIKPFVKWLGFTMKRNPFFTLRPKLRGKELQESKGKQQKLKQRLKGKPKKKEKIWRWKVCLKSVKTGPGIDSRTLIHSEE